MPYDILTKARLRSDLHVEGGVALDLSNVTDILSSVFASEWTVGTGAGQIQYVYHDRRTFTTFESLDLTDGSLSDPTGRPVSMSTLRFLRIVNRDATNNLDFEQGALLIGAGDRFRVRPGMMFEMAYPAGVSISVSSTVDLIASTCTYDIIALGS